MAPSLSPTVRWLLRTALGIYQWLALHVLTLRRRLSGVATSSDDERVLTGQAWAEFCDTLKAAGASLNAPGAPRDAFNQVSSRSARERA